MRKFWQPLFMLIMIPLVAGAIAQKSPSDTSDNKAQKADPHFLQRLIVLTNAERAKAGLPPLKLHSCLSDAAGWLAQDMADHNYMDHTDHQGRNMSTRISDLKYEDFETLAENVGGGQTKPEDIFADWMRSTHHRANILDPNLREIGVGHAYNANSAYKHYWVLDFGARFDAYPVVVNDGSGETHTPAVKLSIYGEGWAQKMRLSNDGVTWTEWESYRAARDWKLDVGNGKKTVFVEISDGHIVRRVQDLVELMPESPQIATNSAKAPTSMP